MLEHALPPGEEHKNLDTAAKLYGLLTDARLERQSPVIALGGGVVGDTVGFAAATYLRGLPFAQCPTTLLAMVDASVGGKVGVNLPAGKNLVGSFYQPRLVVIDTDTLTTLPPRELRCGLAECVKHAAIRDAQRFDWLEQNLDRVMKLDPATLVELVHWNVQIKASVVMADEKETGERAHLNFGHTFAHAIETLSGYGHYHHGEAVSLGMVAAANLAAATGRCEPRTDGAVNPAAHAHRPADPGGVTCRRRTSSWTRCGWIRRSPAGGSGWCCPISLGHVVIADDVEDRARSPEAWEILAPQSVSSEAWSLQ